ncbi:MULTISPECIES: TIGR00730 family Rossman fold protein [Gammaproteobacteria]|uniref:LOG family protein n=1 Tax=Gammaproteobacteria TaxID=1236 RepID=UPI000DCF8934|nr:MULTISPECIES: TIGR00730 family Rossman fold protein [Gammaproteobacteria]RTE86849.1 TIGR00730 family Rossman fold protein [Aliidiomarina sp. B3213]TCZ93362.1 TIGR00730 family Rossman fold protein [Lysobacter sp. N42]
MSDTSKQELEQNLQALAGHQQEEDIAKHLANEWQKAENTFNNESVHHTISIFGSARIPAPEEKTDSACSKMSRFYQEAQQLAYELGKIIEDSPHQGVRLITGGGPGIMEAASRGSFDAGHPSIGLNIVIPREQRLNPFIAAKHSIEFQYFALRKMYFLRRAKALIVFPGGFGTLDELFETLTLIQTKKMKRVPVILYGKDFWARLLDLAVLEECGLIDNTDESLYQIVDSVPEALEAMQPVFSSLNNSK